jgi:hypothetical protein
MMTFGSKELSAGPATTDFTLFRGPHRNRDLRDVDDFDLIQTESAAVIVT